MWADICSDDRKIRFDRVHKFNRKCKCEPHSFGIFFTFFLLNCLFFPANHVKEKNGRYVTVNIHKISVSKQINATGVTYEQQKTKET